MQINPLAVIAAAASSFLLGGLWYSKVLFLPAWARAAPDMAVKMGEDKHTARVFAVSFLLALAAALVFALWLGPNPPLAEALQRGLMAGVGLVGTMFGINYAFSRRPLVLWAIDAGYHAVQFLIFGLILGLWH